MRLLELVIKVIDKITISLHTSRHINGNSFSTLLAQHTSIVVDIL